MVQKDNRIEQKKRFMRDWERYILSFEDDFYRSRDEYSRCDRDIEVWLTGGDVSGRISERDKIRTKRYKKEDCKR